jgi:hypothetical protein
MSGEVYAVESGYHAERWDERTFGSAIFRHVDAALMHVGFEPCGEEENQYEFTSSPDEPVCERRRRRVHKIRSYTRANPRRHRHSSDCTIVAVILGVIGFWIGRNSK